jgi:hypothetical protein
MAPDLLAISTSIAFEAPLISLESALSASLLQSGLRREDYLRRLMADLHQPRLQPLLWVLPRRWRLAPAQLPTQLHGLAQLLEQGLLSPALLAVLGDELAALVPSAAHASALERWRGDGGTPVPSWPELLALAQQQQAPETIAPPAETRQLAPGLAWQNVGLQYSQNANQRQANAALARALNQAASKLDASAPAGTGSRAWLAELMARGWQARARCRASIASFGLGASLEAGEGGWHQVPIALPMRTGLLDRHGQEIRALLPHSSIELELQGENAQLLLQFYQGTEGLCGWEAMNDLRRPWQNDRHNGTVRYQGEPWQGEALLELMDLTDVMGWVHNTVASEHHLQLGGYGTLGYCIDTTALVQQASWGHCELFPVVITGLWRERLRRCANALRPQLPAGHGPAIARYLEALDGLPLDLSQHGASAQQAWLRLKASQPSLSPLLLVQNLQDAPDDLTAVAL